MPKIAAKIQEIPVGDVIEEGMREYSAYVLEERHFPDLRDGLKPVQRRLVYSMFEDGHLWSSRFTKCAAIVGNTTARYHPHSDNSCYSALVGMAGEPGKDKKIFIGPNSNYPVIEGYGNFGSIDGDDAAAMRYPEAKLSELAKFLFNLSPCIKYTDNYLNNRKEPIYLPATLPFLLLNGVSGIGVGLTTDIPSHNLGEVCDGLIYLLETKKPKLKKLLSIIKGPDWQYGGMLRNKKQIEEVYATGKGTITWGLETSVKQIGKKYIINITGIPPVFKLSNYLDSLRDGSAFKKLSKKLDTTKAVKNLSKLEISDKINIQVEVTDPEVMDMIVNHTYTTKNHWNVTLREKGKVKFKTLTLMSFMKTWVDYCIKVHKKYFRLELDRLIKEIRLDYIRVKIAENHNKVIKWIREGEYHLLQKFLKCTDEELEYVKQIRLRSFEKTNSDRLMERIVNKRKEIADIIPKLESTEKYLISFFKEAKKYSRERRTVYLE